MRTGIGYALALSLLFAAGCEKSQPTQATALTIQVNETATELDLVGVDAAGVPAGELVLKLGTFRALDDDRMVNGRSLKVKVGRSEAEHLSAGLAPLELPLPVGSSAMHDFLIAPEVMTALSRWHVAFTDLESRADDVEPTMAGGEVPYLGYCQTTYGNFVETNSSSPYIGCGTCDTLHVSSSCGQVACKQWNVDAPNGITGQHVICGAQLAVVQRRCVTPVVANANTPCGLTGPKGCSVCWSTNYLQSVYDNGCVTVTGSSSSTCTATVYNPL